MIEAGYFDGRTSRCHRVQLQAGPDGLELRNPELLRIEGLDRIRISEPLGNAPRTLTFPDGAFCEVAQSPELDHLLAALGHRDGIVARWQAKWPATLLALAMVAVVLAGAYRWGLPWLAERTVPHLPAALVTSLSQNVMDRLDQGTLTASRLPEARQREIEQGFRGMIAADPRFAATPLLFRRGGIVGPNAFALPDGRVVLLDELVELAPDDDAILAVLAHEMGHAKFSHGLRQLLQSSVVAMVVAGYLGDVSSLASGLGALLLQSGYSREFEFEADAYGATLLDANGKSPEHLALMLEKLDAFHSERYGTQSRFGAWLSSHPETAERVARLREGLYR